SQRNGSRLHPEKWENIPEGPPRGVERRSGSPARLSRRSFPAELISSNETNETIDGLARAQTQPESRAEADSDTWPCPDGQRARAESARAQGNDQSGDDRQPGARRTERRAHSGRQLQRREFSERRNGKSSGETGAQSL